MANSRSDQPELPLEPAQRVMLERLCMGLARRREWRSLVQVAERWSAVGQLPAAVALAEARALLELRLMDRAWVRLQQAQEAGEDELDILTLTAEMFLERGWPLRARKPIRRALELDGQDQKLRQLAKRAQQPPLEPDPRARELERTGTPEQLLELAERFLCTGSKIRALSILERLRRKSGPWAYRVEELLWGLSEDFESDENLLVMAESVAIHTGFAEREPTGDSEGFAHMERTMTGVRSELPEEVEEGAAFPALFRWVDQDEDDFGGTEVTAVSRLADLVGEDELPEMTEDLEHTGSHDTRIQRVVHRDMEEEEDADPILDKVDLSRLPDLTEEIHETSEVGEFVLVGDSEEEQDVPDSDLDPDSLDLELEDADLIVMTRREGELHEELQAPGKIEVVPHVIKTYAQQEAKQETLPTPPPLPPSAPLFSDVQTASWREEPTEEYIRRARRKSPVVWLLPAIFAVGLAIFFAVFQWNRLRMEEEVLNDVLAVLRQGTYTELLQAEVRMEGSLIAEADTLESQRAAHALLSVVIWGDYTGGKARLQVATEEIRQSAEAGGSALLLTLASAWRSFYLGDDEAALAPLENMGPELDSLAEAAHLRARIASRQANSGQAQRYSQLALELEPGSPRYALGWSQVCLETGDVGCAMDKLQVARDLGASGEEVDFLEIRIKSMEATAAEGIDRLRNFLRSHRELPPRLMGRAYLEIAQGHELLGESLAAKRSLERALAADGENPRARYLSGVLRLGDNDIKLAHADFRACFQSLPGDVSCHVALVHTLLEMDRVVEARQHLDERSQNLAAREEVVLMSAWVSLAEQSATSEGLLASWTEKLERPQVNPLVRYLVGQLEGQSGDSSRAEALLVQAARELWESQDPFLRRNVARAYASAARFGVSDSRAEYVEEALLLGSADPLVLVELALYFEAEGDSDKAAEHMDLAATLGLESALAQYARGLYYLDQGQMRDRTRQSWRRYRQLRPSGPRMQQVENWLVELR